MHDAQTFPPGLTTSKIPLTAAASLDELARDQYYLDDSGSDGVLLHVHMESDVDFYSTRAAVSNRPNDDYLTPEARIQLHVIVQCTTHAESTELCEAHATRYGQHELEPAARFAALPSTPTEDAFSYCDPEGEVTPQRAHHAQWSLGDWEEASFVHPRLHFPAGGLTIDASGAPPEVSAWGGEFEPPPTDSNGGALFVATVVDDNPSFQTFSTCIREPIDRYTHLAFEALAAPGQLLDLWILSMATPSA